MGCAPGNRHWLQAPPSSASIDMWRCCVAWRQRNIAPLSCTSIALDGFAASASPATMSSSGAAHRGAPQDCHKRVRSALVEWWCRHRSSGGVFRRAPGAPTQGNARRRARFRMKRPTAKAAHSVQLLKVEGISAPVEVRRHPTARRLTLRVSRTQHAVILTMPRSSDLREADRFLLAQSRLGVRAPRARAGAGAVDERRDVSAAWRAARGRLRAGAARQRCRRDRRARRPPRSGRLRTWRTRTCAAPAAGLAARRSRARSRRPRSPVHARALARQAAAHHAARSEDALGIVLQRRAALVLLAPVAGAARSFSTTSPPTRSRTSSR